MQNLNVFTYVPSYRKKEAPLINLLMYMPVIGAQVWACSIGWLVAFYFHNVFLGTIAGLISTIALQIRWSAIPFPGDGWTLTMLSLSGLSSSLALYLAQPYPGLIVLGWCFTGILNIRLYRWFVGQPVVFENRSLNEFLTFLLGPIYWALLTAFALIILLLSAISAALNWRP